MISRWYFSGDFIRNIFILFIKQSTTTCSQEGSMYSEKLGCTIIFNRAVRGFNLLNPDRAKTQNFCLSVCSYILILDIILNT